MAVGTWWRKLRTRCGRGHARLVLALGTSTLLAALCALEDEWPPSAAALLLGPVLACVRLDARRTSAVAVWTLLLALGAGAVRHHVTTPGFGAGLLVLLAGSALAVRDAAGHTAREAALAHAQAALAQAEAALVRARQVAQTCQSALLQPLTTELDGIEVRARHHSPEREASVGGDLYETVRTPYGPRLIIADVRGHGLEALRTTAATLRSFRDLVHVTPGLDDLARALDLRLCPDLGPEDFVTAILAEFAPDEVRLVNCGHPAPVRVGAKVALLEPPQHALPLGLHPTPRPHRVLLHPGDRLLFYTDGLSEARDANGADFPLLEGVSDALAAPSSAECLDALLAAVTAHTGGPPVDDLALVLCQPTPAQDDPRNPVGQEAPAPVRAEP
ncbi:PP2C family protein-serine/threonine phosphatase [Streptomyces sp. NPDC048172]|uniref:PP2C family protein-serine/threonine phosphatase n=1 Tax=Streptomyces sp. NPDC048172 TaxID=3365505 RepID=UPI003720CFAD